MEVLMKRVNSRGVAYCLAKDGETFGVWKLCENYSRNTKGGIRKTWRYVEKGMTQENAEKLFARRTK